MKLAFVKMHGIGNDFVLIDNQSRRLDLGVDQIRLLADRRRGIGCDQLLIIEPSDEHGADVRARIFNSDGSESHQCGNGLRCLVPGCAKPASPMETTSPSKPGTAECVRAYRTTGS